jgi:hypothetical protein
VKVYLFFLEGRMICSPPKEMTILLRAEEKECSRHPTQELDLMVEKYETQQSIPRKE